METALTRLFDLDVPVVSAPMAGVADAALAAAVTRAGGLGCLGIGSARSAPWIEEQLQQLRESGLAFGAGLMAWALAADRTPFDLVLAARPALLSVAFGEIAPWTQEARDAGIPVAVQVGTVADAIRAEQAGATLVVARGAEAGGHGENAVSTLPLLQQVLAAVSVPVLAAGGIATARGLAAVLAAGAAGAWVGTAFAGTVESTAAPTAKHAMAEADASSTTYGRLFDIAQRLSWPARFGGRGLANEFTRTWAGREHELEATDLTAEMATARAVGDVSMAPVYCGQGVGQIRVDVPAAEVMADFAGVDAMIASVAGR